MADHHLPDELLLEYATGAADPAVALMVASHATLCPQCRQQVERHEAVAGAVFRSEAPKRQSATTRAFIDRVMARTAEHPRDSHAETSASAGDGILPWPLQDAVGPYASLPWKALRPGIDVVNFKIPGSAFLTRMLRLDEGFPIPLHGHRGLEMDLILTGGLRDHTRGSDHHRGDVQLANTELDHELEILPGEACTVFTVTRSRVVPRGLRSRMIYAFLGF